MIIQVLKFINAKKLFLLVLQGLQKWVSLSLSWRTLVSANRDKGSTHTRRHKVGVGEAWSSVKQTESNSERQSDETGDTCPWNYWDGPKKKGVELMLRHPFLQCSYSTGYLFAIKIYVPNCLLVCCTYLLITGSTSYARGKFSSSVSGKTFQV